MDEEVLLDYDESDCNLSDNDESKEAIEPHRKSDSPINCEGITEPEYISEFSNTKDISIDNIFSNPVSLQSVFEKITYPESSVKLREIDPWLNMLNPLLTIEDIDSEQFVMHSISPILDAAKPLLHILNSNNVVFEDLERHIKTSLFYISLMLERVNCFRRKELVSKLELSPDILPDRSPIDSNYLFPESAFLQSVSTNGKGSGGGLANTNKKSKSDVASPEISTNFNAGNSLPSRKRKSKRLNAAGNKKTNFDLRLTLTNRKLNLQDAASILVTKPTSTAECSIATRDVTSKSNDPVERTGLSESLKSRLGERKLPQKKTLLANPPTPTTRPLPLLATPMSGNKEQLVETTVESQMNESVNLSSSPFSNEKDSNFHAVDCASELNITVPKDVVAKVSTSIVDEKMDIDNSSIVKNPNSNIVTPTEQPSPSASKQTGPNSKVYQSYGPAPNITALKTPQIAFATTKAPTVNVVKPKEPQPAQTVDEKKPPSPQTHSKKPFIVHANSESVPINDKPFSSPYISKSVIQKDIPTKSSINSLKNSYSVISAKNDYVKQSPTIPSSNENKSSFSNGNYSNSSNTEDFTSNTFDVQFSTPKNFSLIDSSETLGSRSLRSSGGSRSNDWTRSFDDELSNRNRGYMYSNYQDRDRRVGQNSFEQQYGNNNNSSRGQDMNWNRSIDEDLQYKRRFNSPMHSFAKDNYAETSANWNNQYRSSYHQHPESYHSGYYSSK